MPKAKTVSKVSFFIYAYVEIMLIILLCVDAGDYSTEVPVKTVS